MKRIISMIVLLAMLCSMFMGTVSAETKDLSLVDINTRMSAFNEAIIKAVEQNSVINSDGMTIKNEGKIVSEIAKLDLTQIQADCEARGATFENPLKKEEVMKSIKSGIAIFNNGVKNKELKVLENGTIVETNDNNFYLQGGIDSREIFWWGSRDYMCTNCAWEYKRQLDKASIGLGAGAGIGALFSAGVSIVAGIVTVAYLQNQGADVSYYNSITNNGIILDQNYWLTYSIQTQ